VGRRVVCANFEHAIERAILVPIRRARTTTAMKSPATSRCVFFPTRNLAAHRASFFEQATRATPRAAAGFRK